MANLNQLSEEYGCREECGRYIPNVCLYTHVCLVDVSGADGTQHILHKQFLCGWTKEWFFWEWQCDTGLIESSWIVIVLLGK